MESVQASFLFLIIAFVMNGCISGPLPQDAAKESNIQGKMFGTGSNMNYPNYGSTYPNMYNPMMGGMGGMDGMGGMNGMQGMGGIGGMNGMGGMNGLGMGGMGGLNGMHGLGGFGQQYPMYGNGNQNQLQYYDMLYSRNRKSVG